MAEGKNNYAGGDEVNASDLNQIAQNANKAGGFIDDLNAGETMDGSTTPVVVCLKPADGELYKADASYQDYRKDAIGVVHNNTSDGNPAELQAAGLVDVPSQTLSESISSAQDQSANDDYDDTVMVLDASTDLVAQTIRIGHKVGNISSVKLYMMVGGNSRVVTVSIYAIDSATGKPTGSALASAAQTVSAGSATQYTWTFSTPYEVNPGELYALVISCEDASPSNNVYIYGFGANKNYLCRNADGTATYANTTFTSTNGGSSWSNASYTLNFITYTTSRKTILGDSVFLSETAGGFTFAEPTTAGSCVIKIGELVASTLIKLVEGIKKRFMGSMAASTSLVDNVYFAVPHNTYEVVVKIRYKSTRDIGGEIILRKNEITSATMEVDNGTTTVSVTASWSGGVVVVNGVPDSSEIYFYSY